MAFERLVHRFRKPVCATVYPIVRDWHATQDVAQETFAAAFVRLSELSEPLRFRAWLFRIAHNQAVSAVRRRRIFRPRSLDSASEDAMIGLLRASECVITDGRDAGGPGPAVLERVRRAVLTLPNGYGPLLIMRYVEGLSVDEMAVATGRSVKSIKAVLYRARVLARKVLVRSGLDIEKIMNEV
jgi:RNA polymerase sigma-70 factor (ECF subfamily)